MFRARQQADLIKNNVDFDIWKVSDVQASTQAIRTRFFVYPSFELYAIAITTWFAAIEDNIGTQPQRIVAEQGAYLLEHAAFLTTRLGFREWLDTPVELPEYLSAAAYCTLDAVNNYADHSGNCTFATVCFDTMASTRTETERRTWAMQPATVGTMCTFNPAQAWSLKGEEELRNEYGAPLMAALANDLTRLGKTGSLHEPFVGQFPNFIHTQIFAATLESPLLAAPTAAPGTRPTVPRCMPTVGGCSFGVVLGKDTAWTVANPSPGVTVIQHDGSRLCLDVGNSLSVAGTAVNLFTCNGSPSQAWSKRTLNNVRYALASADGKLCATVEQPVAGKAVFQPTSRGLQMQPCDGRALQQFSNTDGKIVGPN